MKRDVRRWRFWTCFGGETNSTHVDAREEIRWLELKGFKAKIWAPLPQHKRSGHVHVVVLSSLEEYLQERRKLMKLTGVGKEE